MRYQTCIDVHLILRRGEQILLGQRQNTGFADGSWHLPSGHTEDGESATTALIRETSEEIGLRIDPAEVRFVHLMHHRTDSRRIALFFEAARWHGEPENREPDKCSRWDWFALTDLPADMIPYAAQALTHYTKGEVYAERGWGQPDEPSTPHADRGTSAMPMNTIAGLIADIGAIDWDNLAAVAATSDKLLTALDCDRRLLRELAKRAVDSPHLVHLCEHYDVLDKIVLHDDPSGWRLRLHVFLPGYFDRPHNHRWTYSSRILHGSYTHTLYGTDDQLGNGNIDVATLRPRMVRTESTGDFYTLHHTMIHSVTAQPYTTSLIVRGPAVKDRFLVTDRATGQAWWQYGAATEPPDEAARKRMNATQANTCLAKLTELGVLN